MAIHGSRKYALTMGHSGIDTTVAEKEHYILYGLLFSITGVYTVMTYFL